MIKQGSRWGGNNKVFVVLHTVVQEGHTWVHYREEDPKQCREYSCYEESFRQRFTEMLNDN